MISGLFLYTAIDPVTRQQQLLTRRSNQSVPTVVDATRLEVSPEEMKAAIILFYSLLDEQQRHLYAGLESMKLGHGGDSVLAEFLGLDPHTIEAIEILLEHDTAGDLITGIRWTHKTPAGIAELLRQLDIEVSANTVARLLHDMDFYLRVNRKAVATDSSPDRDQQFRYISSLRTHFERQGLPIISVDTKKGIVSGSRQRLPSQVCNTTVGRLPPRKMLPSTMNGVLRPGSPLGPAVEAPAWPKSPPGTIADVG